MNRKPRALILFSGTKSFSKVLEPMGWEVRTLDIDPKFEPFYLADITKWDYKRHLKEWMPDYIHASPVCKEFTIIKNINPQQRDLKLGFELMDSSLRIIRWANKKNQNLRFTIENPENKFVKEYPPLKRLKKRITSYCKYGFPYQKDTIFWYGGFDLKLKPKCSVSKPCAQCKKKPGACRHKVSIKFKSSVKPPQISDIDFYKELRKQKKYKDWTDQEFRFRIPKKLIQAIDRQL